MPLRDVFLADHNRQTLVTRTLRRAAILLTACVSLGLSATVHAAEDYTLPAPDDALVGKLQTVQANASDTLVDIARARGFGYDALRAANPAVDAWMPRAGTTVVLPSLYLLPDAPREGIVVNTAEMRLYYYPRPKRGSPATVQIFPVAIGRGDWSTPKVLTRVVGKVKDPAWYPPESIRAEHAKEGDPLPKVVPGGPNNPLGLFALRLSIPSYLIHGTNKQYGIGMQVTHGCIRMYPEDIDHIYHTVPVGTPVRIVYEPVKLGWHQGQLYLEVHAPLDGVKQDHASNQIAVANAITEATQAQPGYPIDWHRVRVALLEASGIPEPIGPVLKPTPPASQSAAAAPQPAP